MVSYYLHEEGITFFVDGIIVYDVHLDGIKQDPHLAIKALNILENHLKTENEILELRVQALKGGDMQ